MYLVFMFAFPINDDMKNGKLSDLYNTIMIFDVICAMLVLCQIMSGARRIENINPEFGKVVRLQGFVFFISNGVGSFMYYVLGQ